MFRGTFTALVTPFRDGGIDDSAFKKLIETQVAAGITGIVAIGTTGGDALVFDLVDRGGPQTVSLADLRAAHEGFFPKLMGADAALA